MVSLWTKAGASIVIQLRTPGVERLSTCPSVLDQLHLRMPAPPHRLEKDGSWLLKAFDWSGEVLVLQAANPHWAILRPDFKR